MVHRQILLGFVDPEDARVGAADGGDRVVAVEVPGEADCVAVAVAIDVGEDGRVGAEPREDLSRGAAAAPDGGDVVELRRDARAADDRGRAHGRHDGDEHAGDEQGEQRGGADEPDEPLRG